ncbi:MAG: hypothetical protein GX080_08305 [Tissierellia bacterium]|nr:hypothetical protein [Tissierellia bacterium]
MVVILESRIEKRKKLKKQKRIGYMKALVVLLTFLVLYFGIKLVNEQMTYLGYMDNPTIFSLDLRERRIELFGDTYLIDIKILKKVD